MGINGHAFYNHKQIDCIVFCFILLTVEKIISSVFVKAFQETKQCFQIDHYFGGDMTGARYAEAVLCCCLFLFIHALLKL